MSEKYQAKRSESFTTPEVRWAYPFIHEKSSKRPNGQPRKAPVWIITGLFPKLHRDPAQCANYKFLADICMQAVTRETTWGGQFPAGGHWPIQDGDAPPKPKPAPPGQVATPVDPNKGAWRRGHWLIEASTALEPGPRVAVVQAGQIVEIPARVINGRAMYKGGDFGFGSIHTYTFYNEKWGVNFGFEGILWTREGDPIGSSGPRSAAQMFGGVALPPSPIPGAPVQHASVPMAAAPVVPAMARPQTAAAAFPSSPPPLPGAPPTVPAMAPSPAPAVGMPPLPPMPGR